VGPPRTTHPPVVQVLRRGHPDPPASPPVRDAWEVGGVPSPIANQKPPPQSISMTLMGSKGLMGVSPS